MRVAIIVVIAAIFAGGAFFILSNYLEEREKRIYAEAEEAKPGVAAVEVVVADIDLPAGTAITSSQLKWQPWPDDSLDGDYIAYREEDEDADKSDLEDQLLDMVVRRAIMKGEPVTLPKLFAREDAVFMAGMLSPGMRAVAIKVKDVTGVGGFVMPGDHVDVIVTVKWKIDPEARKGGLPYTEFTSETIVQNARVMAVDQAFGDFEENAVKADTVTLEVTPKQAEVIAVATGIGDLSLSLRSLLPGGAGAFSGFTSDRESLYAMGGSFPTTDRLAQPVAVAATDGATDGKRFRTVTAVRDIPPGTLLRATDVEWTELSPDVPPEDYLVQGREQIGLSQLAGALLTAGVKAGEPLPIASLLVSGQPEFLASALRPGMRAASVAVAPGAFIGMPGDEVDVVLVASVDDRRFSETILQKARILSISLRGNMAAIEVTPKQYEAVAVAQSMGEVSLSLRSRNTMLADFYGGQFTSDLEVSRAMSGGAEALAARAGVGIAIEPTIVTEAAPMALVVAAGRELRVGDLLRESDFQWVELPADVTEGRYFAQGRDALEQLRGALVKESVAAGAPIEVNMVMRASEPGFLAAAIMPGLRAADIPLPDSSNIGGFVVPGDLVDVVLTATVGERRFSETILQEVRVLAYNAQRNTATVEVSAKQSETLAVAQTMGPLQLSLRSGNTMLADVYGGRFTSDLEVSHAMSGGAEALETAAGPEQATEEASLIMVLAAKRELRSGSFLRDSDLELIPLPEGAPERRYFSQEAGAVDQETGAVEQATSAVEQLRGALVTATIPAGAPLEADMIIGTTEQGFLTAALAPGMRAVSVAINDVTGLSGFASPGDRVDVVLTYTVLHTEFEQKERTWSETILQNVRLLSITQRVDPATGMPTVGVGHTATMELYPSQVEVLSLAATYGVVSLSLHGPPSDTEPTFGFSYTSDLGVAAGISDFFESGRAVGTAENVATDTPAFTRKAIQVLVAKRALAEGALLKDSDFHFEVLAGDIPAGADYFVMGVVKVETLRGALVTTAIGANEIIPADALMKPAEQGFPAAAIKPGMRASSIRIDQTTGVSGFISPGDVVDVLMTHSVVDISDEPIYSPRRFAETVVSGARVIAVETVTDPVRNRDDWKSAASPQWRKTVTLETTAKQAEVLVLAGSLGSLSFALHSSAPGAVETDETVETSFTSDWEISDSLLSFSLESEPMYRVKHPEILTDPPFEIDWLRELLFPPGLLTDWPPGTLGPAEQQPPTTAAAPAAPAAPIAPTTGGDTGGSIKVFRSSNESTVNVGQ